MYLQIHSLANQKFVEDLERIGGVGGGGGGVDGRLV